jgi:hypothetical protein
MVLRHGVSALREHAEKTNYGRAGSAVADCVRYRTTNGNAGALRNALARKISNAKTQTIGNGQSNCDAVGSALAVTPADG